MLRSMVRFHLAPHPRITAKALGRRDQAVVPRKTSPNLPCEWSCSAKLIRSVAPSFGWGPASAPDAPDSACWSGGGAGWASRASSRSSALGAGETTFTAVARASGGLQATSLTRSLYILAAKRIVARDLPLSTSPSAEARYRVIDPYLRFWLRFVGPHLAEIERGRGDLVHARIRRDWSSWRGRRSNR